MRRTTVLLACATIGLGMTEPAFAQDVPTPLPTLEVDVAAVVAAVGTAVEVELPTLDAQLPTTPTEVAAVPPEPPPVAETPAEAAPAEQYQPPEPQYQAPEDEGVADAQETQEAAATPTSDAPSGPSGEPVDAPEQTATADGPTVPETWTWNWNWNCEEAASVPAPPENATNWNWNWNWNCDADAIPAIDLGQYQSPTTQYQGGNTNIGIRIASPGDDGPVTQTIQTITQVTTTVVTQVAQTIEQVTVSAPAIIVPPALPQEPIQVPWPFDVLPQGKLPAIDVVIALPPLAVPVLPVIAQVVTGVVTGGLIELVSTAPRDQRAVPAPPRARPPSPVAVAAPSQYWPSVAAPVLASAKHAATPRPAGTSAPKRDRRLPLLPVPGGAGSGAGQSASAPALALAALAAALAAYLLVPPLGARRLRRARDRRRLGLLAAPLDRPG